MKKIIIITSIIAILIGGYLGSRVIFQRQGTQFSTISVARGEVIDTVSVTGTVVSDKQIDLQFDVSGRIQQINVAVGDTVEKDEVLIKLDTSELNAQLLSSRASLDLARAKLAKTLAGTSPEEIQIYQAAVEKAEVEVANKEQALTDAQVDADNDLDEVYQDALDTIKTVSTKADLALSITYAGIRNKYFSSFDQLSFDVQEKEKIAQDKLSIAESFLQIAQNNPSHQNIDLALDKMDSALASIRDALAYLRSAMDNPLVSSQVVSTDETSVDTQRSNIDTEITNLTSAKQTIQSTKITNQININTAQANLESAKAALEKAQNELIQKKSAPRQVDVDFAQAEVRQAQANLLQIQAKINKYILRAPVAGVITAVKKEVGEMATANTLIISIISSSGFQIEANVSETEITKVGLGNKAAMTLDALGPNEKFHGQVLKIDPAETVISGVIYYKVTSVFNVDDPRIKPGMTVNLEIETARKENVLYLPYYAIQERDGQRYVRVLEDNQIREKTITTGLEGETKVEIVDGLQEGEQVVVER